MDDLTTLLREAVADVEPTDRRAELHERVVVARRRRHRRAVVGGLAAAAVLVTGGAVAVHQQSDDSEVGPVGPPKAIDRTHDHRPAYALYYLGETPNGTRLFREFRDGPGPDMTPAAAVDLLMSTPDDPDYVSFWSPGELLGATVDNGVIEVEVDPSLIQSSDEVDPDAALGIQQVIYTVQAAVESRLPVQFVHDGNPVAEVAGLPTSEPLTEAPQLDVLALVSISDPSDRRVVTDSFSANGVASSFEGNVPWELRDSDDNVVLHATAQTYGYADRLYPWATGRIDVSDLDPGDYTFRVMTDDPSGGEGPGPTVDTRTVIIK
jgi:hypothetical protein